MPKWRKMDNLRAKNYCFWTFLWICALDFSEIVLDGRHLKVGKSNSFGSVRKILVIPKMGVNYAFLGQKPAF